MSTYYKVEDVEYDYYKYIRETANRTIIVSFILRTPKHEVLNSRYKKQHGEILQPCTRAEYLERYHDYLIATTKAEII